MFNNLEFSNQDRKNKILVVDDSHMIRKSIINLIKETIGTDKYDIVEYNDGIQILNHLIDDINQSNFSSTEYIFSDENMEYLNGSEVFAIIKKWKLSEKFMLNQRLKLICLTGFSDEDHKSHILLSGADVVLTKPVKKDDIISIFD